ncbi:hypothetical protein MPDQ_007249 [Monascus purpureus]|uniref:Potassium uptake protein n=1 Tax=Monascus purpureus TaxID=5098 RepID=A0A507QSM4_MONPU|nr:hypothetical protein MPDQ_007249 [Monascus purpureus]
MARITVVNSNIHTSTVIGVTCAILVVVFLVQPLGITKIASTYAPIVILWLLFNLTFGIYNIATYDASVFKAFSPYFAGHFLEANGRSGWLQLGGIILAFTGVETLFADVGAFSRRAVQISWLCFAYPCLLFSYIGQAAHISVVPSAYANPFYLTVPPGMLYPSLVVAILACIVASQATITGAFQLLAQIMKLSYFPQIELVHTSKKFYGQIYIPLANWIMMIGTVIVAAVFNNTTALGEAYGSCVILVTFLTTCMVAVVALIVWRLPFYVVLPVFSIFALWDGMFLSAALTKVPHGAWVTLMIAAALSAIFILWRYGKEQQWRSEATDDIPLSQTVQVESDGDTSTLRLQSAYGGNVLSRTQGFGIFFDKTGNPSYTPAVFLHFVQKFQAMQDVTVFFHLRPLSLPSVDPADRFTVMRCYAHGSERKKRAIPNCYRLVVRHGYTDEVITPNLGLLVFDQIRKFLVEQQRSIGVRPFERSGQLASELQTLEDAYSQRVVYIVGKEQLRIKKGTNIFRRLALMVFLWIRDQTRTKVQSLNVRVDRLVEVGFVKDI